ncbi:metal-sulfur cluster assembly factor [Paenibacillus sp. NPDC058174]|uniref:metal-sulfur cluster assembly factor n=1 Tax=Paenibacillus sp. NPDC058174 TaxID=3346366 RepID=UPI0036DDA113
MNSENAIWGALEEVIDPEVGANIVDLGLIYDIKVDKEGKANIQMTLTIPECPLADVIVKEVKEKASAVEGVNNVDVHLVWEPRWSPAKMNDRAREEIRARQSLEGIL